MFIELVILLIALFCGILLIRASLFESRQVSVEPVTDIAVDKKAPERLSKAVQFKTVSYQEEANCDRKEFTGLHDYLKEAFPLTHSHLKREVIADYSLLFTWKGNPQSRAPMLLMAHLDVVPIEPGTESEWAYAPFSGDIKEGHVWGRGTMDIKEGVMGILEAVETLLQQGFEPERTIYLAFGHDEEVGGLRGASSIAELLRERGVTLEYVLDEGGSGTIGVVPGVSVPVALVGVAEKGYISLELSVRSEGGHSSMPPRETAAGILSTAISRLEKNRFPSRFEGVVRDMFEYTGPEMTFPKKIVFANLWLFKALVINQLSQSPKTDALIRTTTAPTILEGGTKENVLPKNVRAVVNFRILPGETTETVIKRVTEVINDPRVEITQMTQAWNPSEISDMNSQSYDAIQKTLRQVFPDTVVAPYLVTGATDSRHYLPLTHSVFKIVPLVATSEDLSRIHGTDERISVDNYMKCIQFYIQLIRTSAQ
ncbi:MAG: M20 family peptidase [Theionarchaea archaeon]|nr:M20 family peptidase [Theionarchaea archaeon]